MTEEERIQLTNQLVKLADLMETCDHGDANWREYQRDYRKIAKQLYPEMYDKKVRNPSKKFMNTFLPCPCGKNKLKMKSSNNKVIIFCAECKNTSPPMQGRMKARDSWNELIEMKKQQLSLLMHQNQVSGVKQNT